ncbi:hypothetical protein DSCO28_00390 [Desulfosarcina ovata subsp. sediminis]|uniref:DUF4125 domain-containing protein n=1 Tax=Desulfosarcina ovata subsp. sediminis TaxID=885957 RepID=A0A5K7ZQF1_9BACT|nr:DUF4125 family protein [Desulfosarcina ovata]BBO79473.1 hypothetical protein DSCO28_00390 [Desulfosarcina ovata subsp. sediminis]
MVVDYNLVDQILEIEWEMFQAVKSASPASCQNAPDSFRKIRGSIFETWPNEILESYLDDLKNAQNSGKNLLTEKYARMDNLIPLLNANPLINEIVNIETDWQKELKKKYPSIYALSCRGMDPVKNGSNFSVYLKCELETYSNRTIERYYSHVKKAFENKKNIAVKAMDRLVKKAGYKDIEHAENYLTTTGKAGGKK